MTKRFRVEKQTFDGYCIVDNHFESTSFHIVKEQLINFIDNVLQTPQNYVTDKLYSSFKEATVSNTLFSTKEELESIDEYKLYDYYKEFLNNREIDIYVCGDYNDDLIDLLSKLPFVSKEIKYNSLDCSYKELKPTYLYDNYNQAKLGLLLTYNNISEFEKKYASTILDLILGGLQDSLLMENVREKNSLVYYIESAIYKYDQVILVYAGFNKDNSKKVLDMIDDAINKYTEAMKIAKECSVKLDSATKAVNKILKENGELEEFKGLEEE